MANISSSADGSYFPFPVQLYLKPFIDLWLSEFSTKRTNISTESARFIEQSLQQYPFLSAPLTDIRLLENHREFVDVLFAAILPIQNLNNTIQSITLPFSFHPAIVATEAYHRLVDIKLGQLDVLDLSVSKERLDHRILYAYKFILKKFYDLDLKVDQPVISSYRNYETGLTRYFKLNGSTQFLDVTHLAPLPHLDDRVIQKLLDQNFDPAVWAKFLPPEIFLFSGLSFVSLIDITIEEAVTRLQYNLLSNHDINDADWFSSLQQEMRNLFRLPGLRLGMATLQHNGGFNFTSGNPLWNSLLVHEPAANSISWLKGSVYEKILEKGETIIIEDFKKQGEGLDKAARFITDSGIVIFYSHR